MIQAPLFPIRSLYVLFMAGALIIVLAFIWFIFYTIYSGFSASSIIASAGTNSSESDLVVFFLDNLTSYLLVIGLIITAVWAWVYSQKRGVYVGED